MINSNKDILRGVEKHYTENANNIPECDSRSVGWSSVESQYLRFTKLNSVILESDTNISINDYGCGYAEHLTSLIKIKQLDVSLYNGYDISKEMLKNAKTNLDNLGFSKYKLFKSSSIETKSDYTFVSGTFNNKFDVNDQNWLTYIVEKRENINSNSVKGFSFNMLSTWVDWREPQLYYGDPLFFFKLCKEKFSKKVNLLHDYDLFEWTISVTK